MVIFRPLSQCDVYSRIYAKNIWKAKQKTKNASSGHSLLLWLYYFSTMLTHTQSKNWMPFSKGQESWLEPFCAKPYDLFTALGQLSSETQGNKWQTQSSCWCVLSMEPSTGVQRQKVTVFTRLLWPKSPSLFAIYLGPLPPMGPDQRLFGEGHVEGHVERSDVEPQLTTFPTIGHVG